MSTRVGNQVPFEYYATYGMGMARLQYQRDQKKAAEQGAQAGTPDNENVQTSPRTEDVAQTAPTAETDPGTNPAKTEAYTVKPYPETGSTLWDIAKEAYRKEGITNPTPEQINQRAKEIAEQNGIKDPKKIQPGQTIFVEVGPTLV